MSTSLPCNRAWPLGIFQDLWLGLRRRDKQFNASSMVSSEFDAFESHWLKLQYCTLCVGAVQQTCSKLTSTDVCLKCQPSLFLQRNGLCRQGSRRRLCKHPHSWAQYMWIVSLHKFGSTSLSTFGVAPRLWQPLEAKLQKLDLNSV